MACRLRRLNVEALENRLVLAGNVLAKVSNGSLYITGDSAYNEISISQSRVGELTIAGQAGTKINGSTRAIKLGGVTADVRATMGAGDDRIRLTGSSLTIGDDLLIYGGTGNNTVEALAALRVSDDLSIVNGTGVDMTVITGRLQTGGDVSIRNGNGQSFTVLNPRSSSVNTIGGSLSISDGSEDHYNTVIDTNVFRNVTFHSSSSTRGVTNIFNAEDSRSRLSVGGSVSFSTDTKGRVSNLLHNTDVTGNVSFTTSNIGPANHTLGSTSAYGVARIGGRVSISSEHGDTTVALGDLDSEARGGLTIGRELRVQTGDGRDTVHVGSVQVARSTAVATGANVDRVLVDDSRFLGAVSIATDIGDDEVLVERRTGLSDTATVFEQMVSVDLGGNDDLLRLGIAGDADQLVQLAQGGRFSGGSGTDRRESAGLTSSGVDAVFEQFEGTIEPQPAGLLAYEGFDYPLGSELDTQEGGFGFSSSWFEESQTGFTGSSEVIAGNLNAGNLQTDGDHVLLTSGAFSPFTSQRLLSASLGEPGTTAWVSFVMRAPGGDAPNMGGIILQTLSTSDIGERGALFIGDIGESRNYGLSSLDSFSIPAETSDASSVRATTQALLVVRMEFRDGADRFDLFVNPTAGGPLPSSAAASISFEFGTGQAMIDLVSYAPEGTAQYVLDEVRVGTSYQSVTPVQ